MRCYLVTGGAGFIGSHIAEALLKLGHAVKILDNFSSGSMSNVQSLAGLAREGALQIFTGDIRDRDVVAEAVRDVDVVFHQAAFVSVEESMAKPLECFDVNIGGTATLLEAARNSGVRRVVMASSAAVYGNSEALPLSEDTPLSPMSPYAVSKQANELLGEYYARAHGMQVMALRYFNVYGPRQSPGSPYAAAVPIFIDKMRRNEPVTVFADGMQTRDFIYVGDVVRANLMASEQPHGASGVFNVCSGVETSVLGLLRVMRKYFPDAPLHVAGAPRSGEIYKSLGSPERAAQRMGFTAQCTLEQGLASTVEWLVASGA